MASGGAHNPAAVGSIPAPSTTRLPDSSVGRAPLLQSGCRRFETVSGNHSYGCSSEDESATLRRSRSGVRIAPAVPHSAFV